jgi:protein-L-isoaspartate O-methyltransferase
MRFLTLVFAMFLSSSAMAGDDVYGVLFVSDGCSPCNQMKLRVIPELRAKGMKVRIYNVNREPMESSWKVSSVPSFWVVDRKTRKRLGKPLVGFTSTSTILQMVRVQSQTSSSSTKIRVIESKPARMPVVTTPWGVIDLETYNRPHCNCPMCQGIRQLQSQFRQTSLTTVPDDVAEEAASLAGQESTPDAMIDQMVRILDLEESDVLADLGCGDARILIEAASRTGCRGIGVEIDPEVASAARRAVSEAGVDSLVTIITGDALDFRPKDYGVTAIVCYLYPDLLEKLTPQVRQAGVAISPWHAVPGLPMTREGDLWIWRDEMYSFTR